ncbi:hypothetical protein V1524DRAFT_418825 [Lipomyces starkeyi]
MHLILEGVVPRTVRIWKDGQSQATKLIKGIEVWVMTWLVAYKLPTYPGRTDSVAGEVEYAQVGANPSLALLGRKRFSNRESSSCHTRLYKDQANSEEQVAGRNDTNRKGVRSRYYVRCSTLEEKYFYAQVSCLFTLRRATAEKFYNLAIIEEFIDVGFPDGKADELCNHVDDIQCTVGIVHNSFTAEDYILDRNWDIFDAHEDEFHLAGHED